MSVLILEDNRQILNVLEKLVLSVAEDKKVYVTDNVGEAYKIAMETSIDVFMLDIILYTDKKGDTSGMQYAQSMRKLERYRFTPIIFITSLEARKCMLCGICTLLDILKSRLHPHRLRIFCGMHCILRHKRKQMQ